jgi:hypothetical protein
VNTGLAAAVDDGESEDGGSDDGGSDDGGSEEGGSDDGGGDDGGSDDGGAEDGGAEDGGAEDGGAEDGGADEGGADEGGADDGADDGGADGEDVLGLADPELPGWTGVELTGVGARDVPVNVAGLKYELGDSEAGAEGDAAGAAGEVAGAVAVAELAAAARGWTLLSAGVRPAPIRAMAATADPATRPPVRQAEASGREMRCRP